MGDGLLSGSWESGEKEMAAKERCHTSAQQTRTQLTPAHCGTLTPSHHKSHRLQQKAERLCMIAQAAWALKTSGIHTKKCCKNSCV